MKKIYRLLLLVVILNIADSIFYMSMLWYINNNFKDSYFLGLFFSITLIPDIFIFFLGPIIDKFSTKKLLYISIFTQISCLLFFILFNQYLSIGILLFIIFISTTASTFSYVIQGTLIPKIVDKNEILFANSIFEFSSKVLDSFLNSIISIIIASFGIFILFRYDVLIFILSLLVLSGVKLKFQTKVDNTEDKYNFKKYKLELKEGLTFVNNNSLLRDVTLIFLIINFFNAIQAVAYPIYSKIYFNGEVYYGLLLSVKGISGIIGSIVSSYVIRKISKSNLLGFLLLLNGVVWFVAIFTRNIYLNLALFFIGYFAMSIYNIGFSSIFRIVPPEELLGRVNSTVDSLIAVAMPLGSYIAGIIITDNIMYVMTILPLSMFVGGIYFIKHQKLNEFYL